MNTFRLLAAAAILAAGTSFASADPLKEPGRPDDERLVKVANAARSFASTLEAENTRVNVRHTAANRWKHLRGQHDTVFNGNYVYWNSDPCRQLLSTGCQHFDGTVKTDNWKRQ